MRSTGASNGAVNRLRARVALGALALAGTLAAAASAQTAAPAGVARALVVGVDRYQVLPPLKGAVADAVVAAVSRERPHVVFLLWGAPAQAKRRLIDESRHLVIASPHPSPLSARRGFFGSKPFSRANKWLEEKGEQPVAW